MKQTQIIDISDGHNSCRKQVRELTNENSELILKDPKVVGEWEFSKLTALEESVIPFGVEEVKDNAFYKSENLHKVVFPETLKKIGKKAFCCCYSLMEFNFNEGLEEIGDKALRETYAPKIFLPASVKKLGKDVFSISTHEVYMSYDLAEKYVISDDCEVADRYYYALSKDGEGAWRYKSTGRAGVVKNFGIINQKGKFEKQSSLRYDKATGTWKENNSGKKGCGRSSDILGGKDIQK